MLRKLKKAVKPLLDKAAKSRVGKQVMRIPAPIRKGWAAGMLVPVPGGGTAGASVGAGLWAKDKIERSVAGKLGQPYRLFERKDFEELQPGIYRGARPVRALPFFNHEYTVVVPKHAERLDNATRRKMRKVGGRMALVSGAYKKGDNLKAALGDRVDVAAAKNGVGGLRRVSTTGSTRAARDVVKMNKKFKGEKYPGFFRNIVGAGKNSNSYARSVVEKLTKRPSDNVFRRTPGGDLRVDLDMKTNFMKTTTPAEAILGDAFFKGIAERSGLSRHIEFRIGDEDELARDRRTLKKIAIGTGVAGLAAGLVIRKGRGPLKLSRPERLLRAGVVTAGETGSGKFPSRMLKLKKPKAPKAKVPKVPKPKEFSERRDNLSKARDAAIIGGTGAVGVGAVLAGREAVRTGKHVRRAVDKGGALLDRTAKRVKVEMTPQAVVQEGKKMIKDSVKKRVKKSFPTFVKVARKMGLEEIAPLRKRFGVKRLYRVKNAIENVKMIPRGGRFAKKFPKDAVAYYAGAVPKKAADASRLKGIDARLRKETPGAWLGADPEFHPSWVQAKTGYDAKRTKKMVAALPFNHPAGGSSKRSFETPADRLVEFGNEGQLKVRKGTFAHPLGVASGTQSGYHADELTRAKAARKMHGANHPSAQPRNVDLPVGDMQVIKSAYRVAKGVNKYGSRAGALAKDARDVVTGKARERDASGRKKKREWEKSWAKSAAKNVAITAGVLGYATGMRKSPRFRAANVKGARAVKDTVNKYIPNSFATPAEMLGVTFLAEKREGVSDKVKLTAGGALLGGATGALYGATPGLGSREAYAVERPAAAFRKGRLRKGEVKARRLHIANARKMSVAKKGVLRKVGRGAAKGGLVGAAALGGLAYAMSPKEEKRFGVIAERLTELGRGDKAMRILGEYSRSALAKDSKRADDAAAGLRHYRGKPAEAAVKAVGERAAKDGKKIKGMRFVDAFGEDNFVVKRGREKKDLLEAMNRRMAGEKYHGKEPGLKVVRNPLNEVLVKETKRDGSGSFRFSTPAEGLGVIELDDNAAMAGWDVRDPRGRSARVFAPGSRRRVRREKEWHEEIGNERKLWAAGIGAGAIAGVGAGVALNRPKKPKAEVPDVPVKPKPRPKIVPISSGAKTPAAKRLYRKAAKTAANFLKKTV